MSHSDPRVPAAGQVRAPLPARPLGRGDAGQDFLRPSRTAPSGATPAPGRKSSRPPSACRRSACARATTCSRGCRMGADALRMFLGSNYMGAVYVPINTAYKGRLLEHVVARSDARIIVAHAELAPRLATVALADLETLVAVGGPPPAVEGLATLDETVLHPEGGTLAPLTRPIEPWDTQSIIFTSGTTGPSKGGAQLILPRVLELRARYLALHHAGGTATSSVCRLFHLGGATHRLRHALPARLHHAGRVLQDAHVFGTRCGRTRVTSVFMLGVMAQFLEKEPPTPRDRDHPLRTVGMVPLVNDRRRFHGTLRPGGLLDLQHDRALLPGDDHRAHDRARQRRHGAARLRASRGRHQRLRGAGGCYGRDRGARRHALGHQPRLLQGAGGDPRAPGATAGSTPATPAAWTRTAISTSSTA